MLHDAYYDVHISILYNTYAEGSSEKYQKDFCDMSKPFNTPREEYSVINAMLPRRYSPELQGNIYEQVAESIAKQLYDDVEMVLDYDQVMQRLIRPCTKLYIYIDHTFIFIKTFDFLTLAFIIIIIIIFYICEVVG